MTIALSAREINKLDSALEVLTKYSRVSREIVKDMTGMHHDTAGTAANMINEILKEQKEIRDKKED